MKKIPQDPAGLSFNHTLIESEQFNYTSNWYYLYMSDGKSFAIITLVEDEKNWNAPAWDNWSDLIQELTSNSYENIFNGTIANNLNEWSLYIYKYEEEIL